MAGVPRRQIKYLVEAPAKSEAFMWGVGNKKWIFYNIKNLNNNCGENRTFVGHSFMHALLRLF